MAAAITWVSTIGEDCRVTVIRRAGQRSNAKGEPIAAPNTRASASVAARAPEIRISELSTPSLNIDQAGAVLSMGRERSMSDQDSNQLSKADTLSAKDVGSSSAS